MLINSMSSSNALACRMTRQRISRFDRLGSGLPRARPIKPANNTPSVANISSTIRIVRKVFTSPT